jgi:4-amino-4-deoxy-L-arabinose transferase-like glycosyltransferase
MGRAAKSWFIAVVLLQAGFFLYVSLHRLIDADEGFYLLAARLVLQRKTPYLDFFYTQAPLLPYVYAAWLKLFGVTWISARVLSALLTTALGALLYEYICAETGSWIVAIAAVVLFAGSSLVFSWFPIAKTFGLGTLCLFAAFMILARLSTRSPGWLSALAGMLAAFSSDTRSYVIVVVPILLWWIYRRTQPRPLKHLLYCGGGLVLGFVPSLLLFVASPSAFLFNNLGYHAMRSGDGLIANWNNKGATVIALLIGPHTGIQFSLLCLAGFGMIVSRRKKRESSLLAFAIAVVLGIVSLLPTPAELQYFSMIVPFLIVVAVCFANDYIASLQTPKAIHVGCTTAAILVMSFVVAGVPNFRRYLFTGDMVPGIRFSAAAGDWTLQRVTAVSEAVDQVASPGEEVASFWPGYVFASHANPYPGFENDFGLYVGRRLSVEQRLEYHILSPQEMIESFEHHGPRVAVVGNQGPQSGGPDVLAAQRVLEAYRYALIRKVGDSRIYKCCVRP